MSVNGIGGDATNTLLQKMLKAAQAEKAGGQPETAKTTGAKNADEKTPRQLAEEMQRTAQKSPPAQPARPRAVVPAAGVGGSAANRTTAEYTKYLQANFSFMNNRTTMQGLPTTVSVSPAFIAKCANDPEKAAYLEENLAVTEDVVKKLKGSCPGLTSLEINIDENGDIVQIAHSDDDPKAAAENAKAKARENMEKTEELRKKLMEKRAERKENEEKAASGILTEKLAVRVAEKFETAQSDGTWAAGEGGQRSVSVTGSFASGDESEDGALGDKIDEYA